MAPATYTGNFYNMPVKLYHSFLILARTTRPHKAQQDFQRLKEQRNHKRLK